jgi:hypothetical protein
VLKLDRAVKREPNEEKNEEVPSHGASPSRDSINVTNGGLRP